MSLEVPTEPNPPLPFAIAWLGREQAILFLALAEGISRRAAILRRSDLPASFHELCSHLEGVGALLILGPGIAKYHFRSYLLEHRPSIARRVAGFETADCPSEASVSLYVRKYLNVDWPLKS